VTRRAGNHASPQTKEQTMNDKTGSSTTTDTEAIATRNFIYRKDTLNKRVYQEDITTGLPELIGGMYLQRWFAGPTKTVKITIQKID
jgi:hypothetical protein